MARNGFLTNPFTWLSPWQWRQLKSHRAMSRESEARVAKVLAAYKDLVKAPAYTEVRKETETVLEEQLTRLIETASQCAHCAPIAARIVLMKDVVLRPLQMVWYEAQVERLTPDDEIPEGSDVGRSLSRP